MATILVTGGTGALGRDVVPRAPAEHPDIRTAGEQPPHNVTPERTRPTGHQNRRHRVTTLEVSIPTAPPDLTGPAACPLQTRQPARA